MRTPGLREQRSVCITPEAMFLEMRGDSSGFWTQSHSLWMWAYTVTGGFALVDQGIDGGTRTRSFFQSCREQVPEGGIPEIEGILGLQIQPGLFQEKPKEVLEPEAPSGTLWARHFPGIGDSHPAPARMYGTGSPCLKHAQKQGLPKSHRVRWRRVGGHPHVSTC